jgi:regulator of RNase E activity RraA
MGGILVEKLKKLSRAEREVLKRLMDVSIESAWGVCSRHGYGSNFINGLTCVHPERKMVGRAVTLRYLPVRPDLQATSLKKFRTAPNKWAIETMEPGDALVVDSGGETGAGFVGDVIATRLEVRGGAGIVCDGAVRDLSVMVQMDFALYIRGAHAAGSGRAIVGTDVNIPVRVAGVAVLPGDILMGDNEGVLVIPARLAKEAAEAGAAQDHKENFLRRVLKEKRLSIDECYPPNAKVLKMYEDFKKAEGKA